MHNDDTMHLENEIQRLQAQIEILERQRQHEYYEDSASYFKMVKRFHEAMGLDVRDQPIDFSYEANEYENLFDLRNKLHHEEWSELLSAWEGEDLVEFVDAVCDLIYVLCGTCVSFGVDLDKCFAEVQRSNMSKLNKDGTVNRRDDGKILKSDQFTPPDLRSIIYGSQNSNL